MLRYRPPRLISLVLALLAAISFIPAAFCLPEHTDRFYVNDFAGVISEEVENFIFEHSRLLEEKTSAQLVVAAVESMEGAQVDDFALDLFRSWGIGDAEKNNGVLILLAVGERKVKIQVGYGLEGAINDAKAGRILDKDAVPYFKDDDWNEGIKRTYLSVISEIYYEYGQAVPDDVSTEYNEARDDYRGIDSIPVEAIAFFIALWAIISFIRSRGNRRPPFSGGSYGGDFGGGASFGGGGGSFGGGGGFSGGGGSSGGGGASRGF